MRMLFTVVYSLRIQLLIDLENSRNVFLGLAEDKLNNNDEAESAYNTAAGVKGDDRTVWQGLISLYEKQGDKMLDRYNEVVVKLGHIFATACVLAFPLFALSVLLIIDTFK